MISAGSSLVTVSYFIQPSAVLLGLPSFLGSSTSLSLAHANPNNSQLSIIQNNFV